MFLDHIAKGDPLDVCALAMMLYERQQMAMEHHPCRGLEVVNALKKVYGEAE